jgi:hypothetical protein
MHFNQGNHPYFPYGFPKDYHGGGPLEDAVGALPFAGFAAGAFTSGLLWPESAPARSPAWVWFSHRGFALDKHPRFIAMIALQWQCGGRNRQRCNWPGICVASWNGGGGAAACRG